MYVLKTHLNYNIIGILSGQKWQFYGVKIFCPIFQLASLCTNPTNSRVIINLDGGNEGEELDVTDGLKLTLSSGAGPGYSPYEKALDLLVASAKEMINLTVKYAAIKCRR